MSASRILIQSNRHFVACPERSEGLWGNSKANNESFDWLPRSEHATLSWRQNSGHWGSSRLHGCTPRIRNTFSVRAPGKQEETWLSSPRTWRSDVAMWLRHSWTRYFQLTPSNSGVFRNSFPSYTRRTTQKRQLKEKPPVGDTN